MVVLVEWESQYNQLLMLLLLLWRHLHHLGILFTSFVVSIIVGNNRDRVQVTSNRTSHTHTGNINYSMVDAVDQTQGMLMMMMTWDDKMQRELSGTVDAWLTILYH
jgi:hypothetical protein